MAVIRSESHIVASVSTALMYLAPAKCPFETKLSCTLKNRGNAIKVSRKRVTGSVNATPPRRP